MRRFPPLLIFACVVAALVMPAPRPSARAQQFDINECFCAARLGWPSDTFPANFQFLVDGTRFDLATLNLFLTAVIGTGVGNTKKGATTRPYLETGMHVLVPDEDLLFDRRYLVVAFNAPGQPAETTGVGASLETVDYVDETPPSIGDVVFGDEVFTANCGAKALRARVSGLADDFLTGTRVPLYVRLEAGDMTFETITSAFAPDDDILIAKAPYLGRCIRDEGLETLDFNFGDDVQVTVKMLDYAGNESAPIVKTIQWPIGNTPGTGGAGTSGNAGGCSATEAPRGSALAAVFFLIMALARKASPRGRSRQRAIDPVPRS